MSKNSTQKSTCKMCHRRHPTSLHMEQKPPGDESKTETLDKSNKLRKVKKPEKEAVCSKVSNVGSECMSSLIVPAWLSPRSSSRFEYLVYALLDTQPDTIFILEETENILDPNSEIRLHRWLICRWRTCCS